MEKTKDDFCKNEIVNRVFINLDDQKAMEILDALSQEREDQ